jgi:hypothetical protein
MIYLSEIELEKIIEALQDGELSGTVTEFTDGGTAIITTWSLNVERKSDP